MDTEDDYESDELHALYCLLAGFSELGYHGAYRTLDAQYSRLAQRRRRVFAVFHLGDWHRAAAVLLERESLSGHPAPSREARQDLAGTLGGSSQSGGFRTTDLDNSGAFIPEIVTQAMSAKWAKGSSGPAGDEDANLIANSLRADGFDASEDGTGRGTPIIPIAFDARQSDVIQYGDQSGPLDTDGHTIGVLADTVRSHPRPGSNSIGQVAVSGMAVRRLTPRECARLQGFPDDYLDIIYRGKPAADGPKYKALGNSMAVPVVRWIGERIAMVEEVIKGTA